jgi:hypothetical protein
LSLALTRLAVRTLPGFRGDWARAMAAEVHHCESESAALVWAMGCVLAAVRERGVEMLRGNWRISNWIAVPEMILCFAPLTFAWFDGMTTLSRMTGGATSGGPAGLLVVTGFIILETLGPVGLMCAFGSLLLGRSIRTPWLRTALVVGPMVNGLALLALGSVFGLLQTFDFWCGMVLLSALPALGALHLLRLSPMLGGDVQAA